MNLEAVHDTHPLAELLEQRLLVVLLKPQLLLDALQLLLQEVLALVLDHLLLDLYEDVSTPNTVGGCTSHSTDLLADLLLHPAKLQLLLEQGESSLETADNVWCLQHFLQLVSVRSGQRGRKVRLWSHKASM